jgi:hypothetical protein
MRRSRKLPSKSLAGVKSAVFLPPAPPGYLAAPEATALAYPILGVAQGNVDELAGTFIDN